MIIAEQGLNFGQSANDSFLLPDFNEALEARVRWANAVIAKIASTDGTAAAKERADDLGVEAYEAAYRIGADAYPDVPMPLLFKGVPQLEAGWRSGFCDEACDRALCDAQLG
ncbi:MULTISPECIES: hypothetical protein [Burkholderia]|uniref:Uncharacterized protein n=1 Tax=Burkholderia pseudomallei TaxID=28450 RepID=A0A0C5B4G2_BURPE|nr:MULTISPECIES: hypothetical protein [Burkholderia]AJL34921.1 hypothetical protein pBPS038 [Burkholderia pseudomallei]KWK68739.1 hypothetical protein WM15_05940 [Burkholderia ubonensis]